MNKILLRKYKNIWKVSINKFRLIQWYKHIYFKLTCKISMCVTYEFICVDNTFNNYFKRQE